MAAAWIEDLLKGGLPAALDLGSAPRVSTQDQQFSERAAPVGTQPVPVASISNIYLFGGAALVAVLAFVALKGR